MKGTVAVGLVAAVSLACGCTSSRRPAEPERAPLSVSTETASMTDLPERFETGGVIRARATAFVASRVMAPISAVHVRPGDRVRRGAPLVTLDAREVQANRTRASAASIAAAESARAAAADVSAAESALVLARADHERMSALHARRSATAQELDQAVAALGGAEAQAAGARSRLAAANAARDAAQAAQTGAEVGVSYAVLTAPFDGVITGRQADPGSMATPGTPLLVVEDLSAFRLETEVDEARASSVTIGQSVDVRLDATSAGAGEWIGGGRVAEIARVDPASHSFLIKVDLPAGQAWRSGMFGRARFSGPSRRALTVPASSLVARGQLTFVFLADGGYARLRPVSIGEADHGRAEVLAGVREGARVIVGPPSALTDGAAIKGAQP